MADIEHLRRDIAFQVVLRGHPMEFHSTWGLFSPRAVDEGSYALIREVALGEADVTLDLGCGYGAIGLALARDCPRGRVHLVDKDYVAVEYARKNAEVNGLSNCEVYLSNAFSEVPEEVRFNNIVSNIPANVGKELLAIILHDARRKLRDGGKLYVVTVNGLRKFMQRNFLEVFGNYDKLRQTRHCTVAMAEKRA